MVALEKGDLVKLDFTGYLIANGKVFETTKEEVAKTNGIYAQDGVYRPRLVFYGYGEILKGIEEALPSLAIGEEKELLLKPKEAFGERNVDLLRVIPRKEFEKKGYTPVVGMQLDVNGSIGIVKSVSSGRVVVDFNHPLAGYDVRYLVKLVEVIKNPLDKLTAIMKEIGLSHKTVSLDGDVLKLGLDASLDEVYLGRKMFLLSTIRDKFPDIKRVEMDEFYIFRQ